MPIMSRDHSEIPPILGILQREQVGLGDREAQERETARTGTSRCGQGSVRLNLNELLFLRTHTLSARILLGKQLPCRLQFGVYVSVRLVRIMMTGVEPLDSGTIG